MKLVIEKSKENTILPEVMKSAIKLFVEKGIERTTTKDIAKLSGVSEGALYRHFKSKNDLAWYIFTTNLNEFSNYLSGEVESEKSSYERIKKFVTVCFDSYEKNKNLFTFLILSEHRELDKYSVNHMHPGHVAIKIVE